MTEKKQIDNWTMGVSAFVLVEELIHELTARGILSPESKTMIADRTIARFGDSEEWKAAADNVRQLMGR